MGRMLRLRADLGMSFDELDRVRQLVIEQPRRGRTVLVPPAGDSSRLPVGGSIPAYWNYSLVVYWY